MRGYISPTHPVILNVFSVLFLKGKHLNMDTVFIQTHLCFVPIHGGVDEEKATRLVPDPAVRTVAKAFLYQDRRTHNMNYCLILLHTSIV